MARARGRVLAISDSDMHLEPDYLRHLVRPLDQSAVGISCALYQAWRPANLPEALELLTYNSDFIPAMLFAHLTRTSIVCPGATMAIRREVLEAAGGLEPLADYFVEDFELGRRVVEKGYRIALIPYMAKMEVDLPSFADWWRHQLYWDQNTKAVNPLGFLFTGLARGIPFALLYALLGGALGWSLLAASAGLRILTGIINSRLLKDSGGLKLIWLLPLRDLGGMAVWLVSLFKRRTLWRGRSYRLKKGKMEPVK
jgi:ceramide glucosyltransferase